MTEINIAIPAGESKRLKTAGKYCETDIVVTAEGGGGSYNPPETKVLDPKEVYRTTRPQDWLPMPTPGDDEMYLLGHIPDGLSGCFTAQINWGSSGSCLVEIGTVENGVFVAKETINPPKNERFYHSIAKDAYGNITADGYRQYMVRIKGSMSKADLLQDHMNQSGVYMLVDAAIGLAANIMLGSSQKSKEAHMCLRYVRYIGNGGETVGSTTLANCVGLLSVSADKVINRSYSTYMFFSCRNLLAISPEFFISGISYNYAFSNSGSIALPNKKFALESCTAMFRETNIPKVDGTYIDTSAITSFDFFIYNSKTQEAININISSATSFSGAFTLTPFYRFTFAGETTPGGWTIALTSGRMYHDALVELIDSLPVALAPATIDITGNPGTSKLTEDEIAVATAKNWTVTF